LSRSQDKEKALQILGLYIKRFELLLRKKYANIGQDATACARAIVPLKVELNNLAEGLKRFTDEFGDVETCRSQCKEKIGDAVIALNAPRQMRLEHTDNSFDYLCPPIEQPHHKHPSENQVLTDSSG